MHHVCPSVCLSVCLSASRLPLAQEQAAVENPKLRLLISRASKQISKLGVVVVVVVVVYLHCSYW